jgi:ribosomal protein L11 methyltransferase
MLALFPHGFEEGLAGDEVELVAYTDERGEERLREAFGAVDVATVAEGWEHSWRRFHRPVRIGPLWLGPPWELHRGDGLPVVIDPGRAFGTGAHPTTRLCLELLVELPRGSLADLGAGSGVLAIAAAKLGYAPVTALDVDEGAVEAVRANAQANGVAVQADVLSAPLPKADVAVANIERDVVERLGARLSAGVLVASGYLTSDRMALPGWRHRERRAAEGWAADLFEAM